MTANPTKFAESLKTAAKDGSSQAKQTSEAMTRASTQSADLVKNCYVIGLAGVREYNAKVWEFAKGNTEAGFRFAEDLSGVKSPSEFLELATEYSRKQFETLSGQTKDLTALAQKAAAARVEPLKAGFSNSSNAGVGPSGGH